MLEWAAITGEVMAVADSKSAFRNQPMVDTGPGDAAWWYLQYNN
jgi:hypothetical protein